MISTRHSKLTSAEICRENGWKVGDVLEFEGGSYEDKVKISAIGLWKILVLFMCPCGGEAELDLRDQEWKLCL